MNSNGQDIAAVRSEIKKLYQEFLEGDGRLPEGFSFAYDRPAASGVLLRGTPFDAYLDGLWDEVDSLRNMSDISEWVHLSSAAEINDAAAALAAWAGRHREMTHLLQQKCRVGDMIVMLPVFPCCTRRVMVVLDDRCGFEAMREESVESCKAAGVSFCTILSDRKFFDLIEQQEKAVVYETYPSYQEEVYAEWRIQ